MQHTGARFAQEISTSKPQGIRLGASWIASESPEVRAEFLISLSREEARAVPYLFEFWALEHQFPPDGDWRIWLIMGGRGVVNTRAGAERRGQGVSARSAKRLLRRARTCFIWRETI